MQMAACLLGNCDSLYRTIFVLAAFIVVTNLVSSCHGAPVMDKSSGATEPWWHDSCHRTRHARHIKSKPRGIIKAKRQLNTVISKFENETKPQFRLIYKALDINGTRNPKALPRPPKGTENATDPVVLVRLHMDIQRYGMEVERLLHMEIDTEQQTDKAKRKAVLSNVRNNMKSFLCELETAINETETTVYLDKLFQPHHSKTSSLTQTRVLDEAFLSDYERFLRGWKKVFNKIKGGGGRKKNGKGMKVLRKPKQTGSTNGKKVVPPTPKHSSNIPAAKNRRPKTTRQRPMRKAAT